VGTCGAFPLRLGLASFRSRARLFALRDLVHTLLKLGRGESLKFPGWEVMQPLRGKVGLGFDDRLGGRFGGW
jgi:hypothetical protein